MLKFNRPTLVTITAPTCSGKNYLMEGIERKFGWNRIVSTTTRQRRKGEIDGKDYYFITDVQSRLMEDRDQFAELIEFRGIRYGVTHEEMDRKLADPRPPMVILEPEGLQAYKKICQANGWDVFTIYVSTVEKLRIQRLNNRTVADLQNAVSEKSVRSFIEWHTDRLLSIVTEERRWSQTTEWNVIAPGTDLVKAIEYIELGVKRQNSLTSVPTPYTHVV